MSSMPPRIPQPLPSPSAAGAAEMDPLRGRRGRKKERQLQARAVMGEIQSQPMKDARDCAPRTRAAREAIWEQWML